MFLVASHDNLIRQCQLRNMSLKCHVSHPMILFCRHADAQSLVHVRQEVRVVPAAVISGSQQSCECVLRGNLRARCQHVRGEQQREQAVTLKTVLWYWQHPGFYHETLCFFVLMTHKAGVMLMGNLDRWAEVKLMFPSALPEPLWCHLLMVEVPQKLEMIVLSGKWIFWHQLVESATKTPHDESAQ